ncbi:formylglycine-generating enzyme family protein [Sphingobacterium sp. SRCM116780]|uniref:formylglycine-generating enzyme family protein n=1 Tax=Sphingobacterium sp. SRCM116780 TaxID=2907623 RepID=UPI001F2553D1|nr:SUMF1/EgtB/PvdO family nonheme iron enzyme [Sphingobacterium sp. SRCM116780]UIR55725.1 formylglycine-generating enzyme family protein [Sphingobacterium sp. SRCM116780]
MKESWILCMFIIFCCSRSIAQEQKFITIQQGTYILGDSMSVDNPKRAVKIEAFSIAEAELTNAAFANFVETTHYITLAERFHNAMVFEPGLEEFRWIQDSTAYWRYPNGVSRAGIEEKMNHPVTCISYRDALAYCEWAGVRLPSLDEWEVASRAGSETKYFDGVSLTNIKEFANIWHGRDHLVADTADGYLYTSPVKTFKANPWGLYDVYGNVFEFCEGSLARDKERKVAHARGGSWWCSKNSCASFNSQFIGSVNPNASFSNLGFRIVKKK